MHRMFFYGTLMSPEVFQQVTGQVLKAAVASLTGYQIYSLKDRSYPAIIPQANSEVKGLLVSVTDYVLDKLDWFEGSEYERQKVKVDLMDGAQIDAFSYVLKKSEYGILESQDWDFHQFVSDDLEDYL